LRFRRLENFLESSTVPGLADRAYTKELMVVVGDELVSAEEAKGIKEWRAAMLEKMAYIEENHTWSLVELQKGHRAIGLQ
jgi:hypothetical protein